MLFALHSLLAAASHQLYVGGVRVKNQIDVRLSVPAGGATLTVSQIVE
jgi:hypothetical protein